MRTNDEVAALLEEYADLLAITGGDAFRIRSYEKAARSIAGYPDDLATLDAGALGRIPNVGKAIAAKIAEYLRTGGIHQLEELRAKVPAGVRRLTEVPGLGPKRAMVLYTERGIDSVDGLAAAIDAGRLDGLRGFGPRTEENLLRGIEVIRKTGDRVLLDVAMDLADELTGLLAAVPGCQRVEYAGSLRRMRDTIGDVDMLTISEHPGALTQAFTGLPHVERVVASGDTKTSIRTTLGLQVDLRVVPPSSWGAALQYFTGSRAHNIRIREIAVRKKLKLSEYGLFDVETGDSIASLTEEEVYERLGLPWIPPPLREDAGEIEAALAGELPAVVTEQDLRGDLHTHTDLTDGVASLDDMVRAAAARGYAYYAVTDHAPNLFMQRMTDEKMLAQREQDDPPVRPGRREPARQHPWSPDHAAHRQASAGRREPGRGLQGMRPHRHRHGDRLPPGPAGPVGGARPAGPPARRQVLYRQRRAFGRPSGSHEVRDRHRAARLAHPGRRHQHLAAGPADRLPAQAQLTLGKPRGGPLLVHAPPDAGRKNSTSTGASAEGATS